MTEVIGVRFREVGTIETYSAGEEQLCSVEHSAAWNTEP